MRSDPPRHGAQILYHQRYYLGQDQDWLIAFLREITLATLVIHVDGEFHSTALPLPVNEKIKDAGATLRFLPPCSPDINPIEKAFSRLKDMLRKAAGRTVCCL